MALTIKRLRWFLVAAALLLIVVVATYIGFGRYRAVKAYLSIIRKAGVTISHDSNGVTLSKSDGNRTLFTLHARTVTQLGDGHFRLRGVNCILYSRDGLHNDVLTGDEFTYDEHEGIVRAIGEVHMDLEAPDSLTSAGRSSLRPLAGAPPGTPHEPANVIHVRTSGVVYLRKLGVVATDQRVEFYYGGIEGSAQGAEYNTSLSTLRLLSDVAANGVLRGKPFALHAASADIDRMANVATLPHTAVSSDGHNASADLVVLDLRKDGSIGSAKATGHVLLTTATERIAASQLDASFTRQTVLTAAKLSGGVQLTDTNPLRPAHGSAAAADLAFGARGALTRVTATGSPQFTLTDKHTSQSGLLRELHGNTVVALFTLAGNSSRLRELHVTGSAETHAEALASTVRDATSQPSSQPVKLTSLTADDLDLTLATGPDRNAEPQKLTAQGHTQLRQIGPNGAVDTSDGDTLTALFAQTSIHGKPQLELTSATQSGHVIVHRTASRGTATGSQQQFGAATAATASYNGATDELTLSGDASLAQDNAMLTATTVVLNQRTQDADALGNVQATLARASSPKGSSPYTHVLSASAHFGHQSQQAEFRGTDAQPARMWQDASQVQAAILILDDLHHTFAAHAASSGALVHAVLTGRPSTDKDKSHSSYVRIASAKLDYSDLQHMAVFTGPQGVEIQAENGVIHAQRAAAYLVPPTKTMVNPNATPFNGSLDRVVITGDIQMSQLGRHGTGEQLVYTAATGQSVLTGSHGHPPHIVDTRRGDITGSSLLFGDAGSTIIVSGENRAGKSMRVHTETYVPSGKEERH